MQSLPIGVNFFERGWLSSNNVLIQDTEQAILIDSGYCTHAHQTHALVSSVLHKPLTHLVNTHLHSDHCGGNAFLQSMYPGLNTYVPHGHAHYVDDWNPDALTYTPTGQHCPRFTRTHALQDGDCFRVLNKIWRVYAAPGHDPHSIVIFNEDDGILISADALWENGFGVVFPEIEGVAAFEEVQATLEVIEKLAPKIVLPGHGSMFTHVDLALARARSRLSQFRNDPLAHANYAAKVLLKFKLLDVQSIRFNDFVVWASRTDYLLTLAAKYASDVSFENWIQSLCVSLEKSGACSMTHGSISNTSN